MQAALEPLFLNRKSSDHPQSTPASARAPLPIRYSTRLDEEEERKKGNSSVFIVQIPIESVRLHKKRNKNSKNNKQQLKTLPKATQLPRTPFPLCQAVFRTYSSTWCAWSSSVATRVPGKRSCAPQVRQYVATSNYVAHATASTPAG